MLLPQKISDMLIKQVGIEFNNSNIYLTIAQKVKMFGMLNLGKHYEKQAEEERGHGLKLVDYLNKNLIDFEVPAIPASPAEPTDAEADDTADVLAWISEAVTIEMETTQQIDDLMNAAIVAKDNRTQSFLQWYVDEQVGEVFEAVTLDNIAKACCGNLLTLDLYVK